MKKLVALALFTSILAIGLSGCQNNSTSQSKIEQQKRTKLIQKNKEVWDKKVKKAKNVDHPNYDKYLINVPEHYNDEEMSFSRLKNGNQFVIAGQVINLQPEFGLLFMTETKATIYVEKVISGDKKLQGKTIKTEFSGGLAKAKDYFNSVEGTYEGDSEGVPDPKTIVYSTNPNVPMPKIGSHFIVGMKRYKPSSEYRADKLYKKYGLTTKNFYVINNPEVTYWIKKGGEYRLNNPAFYQKKNANKYPQIFKLTKKLNQEKISN